jgi:hypothetical protein
MAVYSYPAPRAPQVKKPTSVEDCLHQARLMVKKTHGRAAFGPVNKNDKVLIVTLPDQDRYVREAVVQAFKEEGAAQVDFLNVDEFTGRETKTTSVENGWNEVELFKVGRGTGAYIPFAGKISDAAITAELLRKYFNEHPGYTKLFWDNGGRTRKAFLLKEHGDKFKGNWIFNNWEEFLSGGWVYPDELEAEIERRVVEALGNASAVRITDPEGTYIEYTLNPEAAKRWQRGAYMAGHLLLEPHHATTAEADKVSPIVPPLFLDVQGVLAGTANHLGFFPRIELHFDQRLLVDVKGGGKYGDGIRELMDKNKDIHWPGYPRSGFFWYCDCALCTVVKAFRRTSDMFNSYQRMPNILERNRAGVFHMGIGSRRHGEEHGKYAIANNLQTGHIHVHNYFATFEIKVRGTDYWCKIVDKGRITAMDDPEIRALAIKYGDPDDLLKFDWIPPLPGINCEGNYLQDYAPDPLAYLKKRMQEGKPI